MYFLLFRSPLFPYFSGYFYPMVNFVLSFSFCFYNTYSSLPAPLNPDTPPPNTHSNSSAPAWTTRYKSYKYRKNLWCCDRLKFSLIYFLLTVKSETKCIYLQRKWHWWGAQVHQFLSALISSSSFRYTCFEWLLTEWLLESVVGVRQKVSLYLI